MLIVCAVPPVSTDVRLVDGDNPCAGRVEVFYSGQWGTVCDDGWEIADATVVCREVGCGVATDALPSAHFGQGSGVTWLDDVACTGTETSLKNCISDVWGKHNCGHGEDASVICGLLLTVTTV